MSFITACTQCGTNFVVRPEHLMAQQGKVRCGQCNHVFNALNNLQETVEPVERSDSADIPPDASALLHNGGDAETVSSEVLPDDIVAEDTSLYDDPAEPLPAVTPESEISNGHDKDEEDSEESISEPDSRPEAETTPQILRDITIAGKLNPARPRRPTRLVTKIALWLLFIVLVLVAVLQTIYYLRTEITSQWPVLKPYFVQACEQLNCTIHLPRNANLLMVDDSDMQEDAEREGLIHLSSTLVNSASYPQEYPKLEITLTDANEAPVVRRVFNPLEYLPANTNISTGIAAGDEVHIKLALTAAEKNIAGYRVFITY